MNWIKLNQIDAANINQDYKYNVIYRDLRYKNKRILSLYIFLINDGKRYGEIYMKLFFIIQHCRHLIVIVDVVVQLRDSLSSFNSSSRDWEGFCCCCWDQLPPITIFYNAYGPKKRQRREELFFILLFMTTATTNDNNTKFRIRS